MGYIIHHAINVELWTDEKEIHQLAKDLFADVQGIVTDPVEIPINGGRMMTVYSNGSKHGWDAATDWVEAAIKFMDELDRRQMDYACVSFGGDQGNGVLMRDRHGTNEFPRMYPLLNFDDEEEES